MKKLSYIFAAVLALTSVFSCQKDPIGGTVAKNVSGQWYVMAQGLNSKGEITDPDVFGKRLLVLTYNTADNNDDIFVDDLGALADYKLSFKVKAKANLNARTFSVDKGDNLYNTGNSTVTITDARIVLNGAVTPSEQKADYIEFCVVLSDDPYLGQYWDKLKFSGWRYTGFEKDN